MQLAEQFKQLRLVKSLYVPEAQGILHFPSVSIKYPVKQPVQVLALIQPEQFKGQAIHNLAV